MTSRGSGDGNSPLSRPCVADGNPAPDDSGHSEPVPGRGRRKGSARARGRGSRRQASGGRPGLAWTSTASRAGSLGGATSEPWRAARRRDWTANSPRPVTPRSRGRDPTEPGAVDRPLEDEELMAQRQVLEGDGRRPEEQSADECSEPHHEYHRGTPASRHWSLSRDPTGSAWTR